MRILFVTPMLPSVTGGGRTRTFNLIKQLATRHEVSVISFIQPSEPNVLFSLEPYCQRIELVPWEVSCPWAGGAIVSKDGGDCFLILVPILASNHSIARDAYIKNRSLHTARNKVFMGDDVRTGTRAVILPEVTIGTGRVTAAGAVVTPDISKPVVAAGVPAEPSRSAICR